MMRVISGLKARLRALARPLVRLVKPAPRHLLLPVSRRFGFERGTPVARYFVDRFIERYREDITGVVLEIKNRRYSAKKGHGVVVSDVMDVDTTNDVANIYADLSQCHEVGSDRYDCFILTETLQYVFDLRQAVKHAHRILKPGGVLLVSVPAISAADNEQGVIDCWRFAPRGCSLLFGDVFGAENVQVEPYGNYAVSIAALAGMAVEELPAQELTLHDASYVLGICVRAQKM